MEGAGSGLSDFAAIAIRASVELAWGMAAGSSTRRCARRSISMTPLGGALVVLSLCLPIVSMIRSLCLKRSVRAGRGTTSPVGRDAAKTPQRPLMTECVNERVFSSRR